MMYCNDNSEMEARTDEQLCMAARNGDTVAEEQLTARYAHMVQTCVQQYFLAGGERDDLIQEGMMGLLKAIRAFDGTRSVPFEAFARICIKRTLYSAVSAASAQQREVLSHSELFAKIPLFDENLASVSANDPVSLLIGKEEYREMQRKLWASLSAFESRVLTLYLGGCSYKEIAAEVGRPVKSVDNAVQRIRRKASALHLDERR